VGLQRIIFDIFQLTSTEAMSSYEDRCVKIGAVFNALYFENEVGDPQFFCISDIGSSLSDCSLTMKKICCRSFRTNVLKWKQCTRSTILRPSTSLSSVGPQVKPSSFSMILAAIVDHITDQVHCGPMLFLWALQVPAGPLFIRQEFSGTPQGKNPG